MSDRKTAIVAVLDQTRQQLNALLDRLQPGDWETQIQEEDQRWTVRQIISHLMEAQRGMTHQITRINAGEETVPPDFDLNRWNRRSVEKAADKQPPELIAALEEGRTALKQVLTGLSDSDLEKRGRHGSLQIMSIEEIARLIGTHEADHARIIAEGLNSK
ncbi:MAG: DinB family protein [Anaerolineae bacterium]|nr:DinB family protein [Anaerolineae bacterium]